MSTVCIVGAGEMSGAIAHALARGESVRRVVLLDEAEGVAAGKALDIQQAGAVEGFHTQLSGFDDVTRVTGCAVCVLADRAGQS
jgi:malate dehydrogenase